MRTNKRKPFGETDTVGGDWVLVASSFPRKNGGERELVETGADITWL